LPFDGQKKNENARNALMKRQISHADKQLVIAFSDLVDLHEEYAEFILYLTKKVGNLESHGINDMIRTLYEEKLDRMQAVMKIVYISNLADVDDACKMELERWISAHQGELVRHLLEQLGVLLPLNVQHISPSVSIELQQDLALLVSSCLMVLALRNPQLFMEASLPGVLSSFIRHHVLNIEHSSVVSGHIRSILYALMIHLAYNWKQDALNPQGRAKMWLEVNKESSSPELDGWLIALFRFSACFGVDNSTRTYQELEDTWRMMHAAGLKDFFEQFQGVLELLEEFSDGCIANAMVYDAFCYNLCLKQYQRFATDFIRNGFCQAQIKTIRDGNVMGGGSGAVLDGMSDSLRVTAFESLLKWLSILWEQSLASTTTGLLPADYYDWLGEDSLNVFVIFIRFLCDDADEHPYLLAATCSFLTSFAKAHADHALRVYEVMVDLDRRGHGLRFDYIVREILIPYGNDFERSRQSGNQARIPDEDIAVLCEMTLLVAALLPIMKEANDEVGEQFLGKLALENHLKALLWYGSDTRLRSCVIRALNACCDQSILEDFHHRDFLVEHTRQLMDEESNFGEYGETIALLELLRRCFAEMDSIAVHHYAIAEKSLDFVLEEVIFDSQGREFVHRQQKSELAYAALRLIVVLCQHALQQKSPELEPSALLRRVMKYATSRDSSAKLFSSLIWFLHRCTPPCTLMTLKLLYLLTLAERINVAQTTTYSYSRRSVIDGLTRTDELVKVLCRFAFSSDVLDVERAKLSMLLLQFVCRKRPEYLLEGLRDDASTARGNVLTLLEASRWNGDRSAEKSLLREVLPELLNLLMFGAANTNAYQPTFSHFVLGWDRKLVLTRPSTFEGLDTMAMVLVRSLQDEDSDSYRLAYQSAHFFYSLARNPSLSKQFLKKLNSCLPFYDTLVETVRNFIGVARWCGPILLLLTLYLRSSRSAHTSFVQHTLSVEKDLQCLPALLDAFLTMLEGESRDESQLLSAIPKGCWNTSEPYLLDLYEIERKLEVEELDDSHYDWRTLSLQHNERMHCVVGFQALYQHISPNLPPELAKEFLFNMTQRLALPYSPEAHAMALFVLNCTLEKVPLLALSPAEVDEIRRVISQLLITLPASSASARQWCWTALIAVCHCLGMQSPVVFMPTAFMQAWIVDIQSVHRSLSRLGLAALCRALSSDDHHLHEHIRRSQIAHSLPVYMRTLAAANLRDPKCAELLEIGTSAVSLMGIATVHASRGALEMVDCASFPALIPAAIQWRAFYVKQPEHAEGVAHWLQGHVSVLQSWLEGSQQSAADVELMAVLFALVAPYAQIPLPLLAALWKRILGVKAHNCAGLIRNFTVALYAQKTALGVAEDSAFSLSSLVDVLTWAVDLMFGASGENKSLELDEWVQAITTLISVIRLLCQKLLPTYSSSKICEVRDKIMLPVEKLTTAYLQDLNDAKMLVDARSLRDMFTDSLQRAERK
jgi:hypothetical protein